MDVNFKEISIVHWFPELEKHKCGYCKNTEGTASYGMWAENLTVYDYQDLIDRGWRRSGKYCYKPVMEETCCPLYTIKCHALNVVLSKSQKKVIKKMNKFLSTGELAVVSNQQQHDGQTNVNDTFTDNFIRDGSHNELDHSRLQSSSGGSSTNTVVSINKEVIMPSSDNIKVKQDDKEIAIKPVQNYKKGLGPDPDKPLCKKAKLIRLEKKLSKDTTAATPSKPLLPPVVKKIKTLEDFLNDVTPTLKRHRLSIKLIPTSQPGVEWAQTEDAEFLLYKKYQITVHDDPPEKCTKKSFKRFLVDSPLQPVAFLSKAPPGYGSFHQQYWLDDDKLIAVGVIDILPNCVSSVYFFYDPDYRSLTLGTYGSLKEIAFTRELNVLEPSIQYYYMGFYVHSCPKMRYKGKLSPSYLLCPETYKWFTIEQSIPKLEVAKYSRFNADLDDTDENYCTTKEISSIKVLSDDYELMYSETYKRQYGGHDIFLQIGSLIGKKCLHKIVFVISK